jgi:hypothetical protein
MQKFFPVILLYVFIGCKKSDTTPPVISIISPKIEFETAGHAENITKKELNISAN